MAKFNKKSSEEVSSNEVTIETSEISVPVEETETSPQVTIEKPLKESNPTGERFVAIKCSKDYQCTIGGNHYFFEKGKRVNVAPNVKEVLLKEPNLLLPL